MTGALKLYDEIYVLTLPTLSFIPFILSSSSPSFALLPYPSFSPLSPSFTNSVTNSLFDCANAINLDMRDVLPPKPPSHHLIIVSANLRIELAFR